MRRNLVLLGVAVAAVFAVGSLWLFVISPARDGARIATGYVAKSLCSCVFVTARNLQSCREDLGATAIGIAVQVDESRKFVRATAGFLSSDVARFDPLYGCRLT
jgi:hypothetical protein